MENVILLQDGLLLFFGAYFIEARFAIVLLLVAVAMVFDVRSHRIPNWLVFSGALIGLTYQAISPYDRGAFYSLAGMAVGLAAFVPFYLLRVMGAGDVKLMAMVGAFLGPVSVLGAVLSTFIAGGILAIVAAIRNKATSRLVENLQFMMADVTMKVMTGSASHIEIQPVSVGKLPYAIAIAAGTAIHIFLTQSGHALLS